MLDEPREYDAVLGGVNPSDGNSNAIAYYQPPKRVGTVNTCIMLTVPGQILIQTSLGKTLVSAYLTGKLAIHLDAREDEWLVTHVKSGYQIFRFYDLEGALHCTAKLERLDWNSIIRLENAKPKIVNNTEANKIYSILKTISKNGLHH